MHTLIAGILNITPDSFSDGGQVYNNQAKAVERAKHMLTEGADIIDIGGESTRPGSDSVTADEELQRVIPIIQALKNDLGKGVTISIDTNKAEVAEAALENGAEIVNSLGGFTFDTYLAKVVAKHKSRFVMYHIKGKPKTMQQGEITYEDVIQEIAAFFHEQITIGMKHGMQKDQFILDPGIGFGKTVEQNLTIIKHLSKFRTFNVPLMVGVSRKSHLGKLLQTELQLQETPSETERLEAALAETAVAVFNGAGIIRTHDVGQTKKFLTVLDRLKN